ncbi:MAG: hypothetical protein JWM83_1500, partial [Candidatus Angelobacter sp.]|nr:hypothetical protein [Candidatus Angelobacter sp.]
QGLIDGDVVNTGNAKAGGDAVSN